MSERHLVPHAVRAVGQVRCNEHYTRRARIDDERLVERERALLRRGRLREHDRAHAAQGGVVRVQKLEPISFLEL